MLERAAAAKWNVPASECKATLHQGSSTPSPARRPATENWPRPPRSRLVPAKTDLKLKTPAEFRYIGKEVPITDLNNMLNGKAVYGMDARVPGMVFASVQRSPVYGGTLASFDDTEAKKVEGVSGTVTIDRFKGPHNFQPLGGVAVVADSTWAAMQGRKKLQVKWNSGEHASYDSTAYKAEMLATAEQTGEGHSRGRQRRRRIRQGRQDRGSELLRSAALARPHGTARRSRRLQERQGNRVDLHAESASRSGHGRQARSASSPKT